MTDGMNHGALLEAGALVPPGTPVPAGLPVDTVDARVYAHPCLPGRKVVRLVPDALAAGIDAEMALADFVLVEHRDDIAVQRRRALGFPGAVLVHEPERAAYAVQVHRELLQHAKKITTKPGHAKEGIDALAQRLAGEVPSFLPSFWEEAARAYAAGGNLQYAASAFERARASEREFGLPVDEARRDEAYLEFALLGALAVKSLQAYAKDVAKSAGAADGYERFFAIAVKRTLGGLQPWASLAKDLRAAARAAKRDVAAEDERFLSSVLGCPAITKAPQGFFTDYAPSLRRMAEKDPAVHARLLDLFPAFAGGSRSWRDDDHASDWLALLHEMGSLAVLSDPSAPAAALPAGGRASWLNRAQRWIHRHNGALVQLAQHMAPALRVDGQAVLVASYGWRQPLDVDLLDVLLAHEVPVTLPSGEEEDDDAAGTSIDLDDWAARTTLPERWGMPAMELPRDFRHAAAHPKLAELLPASVGACCGREAFDTAAKGKAVLSELRRAFFVGLVTPEPGGLPTLTDVIDRLEDKLRPAIFEEFPELVPRLEAIDTVGALVHTLQGGLPDELGWPLLDEARAELSGKDEQAEVHVAFPWFFVFNEQRVIVLGPTGRVLQHDLRLPKGLDPKAFAWAGDLMVYGMGWQSGWKGGGYWASQPGDTFTLEADWGLSWARVQAALPDGRVFEGGLPFRAGDRFQPKHADLWQDADGVWVRDPENGGRMGRIDPATGAFTTAGRPAFFADVPDDELTTGTAHAQPYPGSLLGETGWYAFKVAEGRNGVGSDGRRTERALVEGRVPDALVRWPGDGRMRVIDQEDHSRTSDLLIRHPDDGHVASKVGVAEAGFLPLLAWHVLSARDEAGSAALRGVTREAAEALLAAGEEDEAVDAAIAAQLPALTHAALRGGVRETVKTAVDLRDRLRKLRGGEGAEEDDDDATPAGVNDQTAKVALSGFCGTWGYDHLEAAIRSRGATLFAGSVGKVHETDLDFLSWLGAARALAICAVRPTGAEQREAAHAILRAWVEAGFADGRSLRRVDAEAKKIPSWAPTVTEYGETQPKERFGLTVGDVRCVVENDGWDESDGGSFVIWQSTEGAWELPAEITVNTVTDLSRPAERAWLEGFLARGEVVWTPSADDVRVLAAAIGRSEAEAKLLLVGLYGIDTGGSDFLGKELREALALKTTDAKAAKQGLPSTSVEERLALYAAAMPDDPALLGATTPDDPAGFVQRFAQAWNLKYGARIPLPEEVAKASRELDSDGRLLLELLTKPDLSTAPELADPAYALDADGDLMATGDGAGEDVLMAVPRVVAFLCEHTPAESPLRAKLALLVARAQAVMTGPDALLPAIADWHYGEGRSLKASRAWFEAIDVPAEVVFEPEDPSAEKGRRKDDGAVVAWLDEQKFVVGVRLSRLSAERATALRKLQRALEVDPGLLAAWDWLQAPDVKAWIAGLGTGSGWEQDPRASAPEAVAAISATTGVEADAAALYLQTLALRSPSKKAVCLWNGWKPKVYDTAAAALVERGLVVAGKRSGAGREVFLPGPWDEALETEAWKATWYVSELNGVPAQSAGRRFMLAAERVAAGDRPAFSGGRR